jgi:hypothetical protein
MDNGRGADSAPLGRLISARTEEFLDEEPRSWQDAGLRIHAGDDIEDFVASSQPEQPREEADVIRAMICAAVSTVRAPRP